MEWMLDNLGTVAAVLAAVFVMIGSIFGAGRWVERINTEHTTLQGNIDRNLQAFRDFAREIRDDVRDIQKDIKGILLHLRPETTASGSPIRLTDLGRSISETLGAPAWAASHAETLVERVIEAPPYDIQELAFQHVEMEFPDDGAEDKAMEALIKQCAYENGLKRKQVLDVLAIELRDCLLRLRQLDSPEESHRG